MSVVGSVVNEQGDSLLIKLSSPYLNIKSIVSYEDITKGETTSSYFSKSFRWSTNNLNYSDWITLTSINLKNLIIDSEKPFWIQYKYEVAFIETGVELEFVSISLEVINGEGICSQIPLSANSDICDDGGNCVSGSLVIEDCDNGGGEWDPYNIGRAIVNYKQISKLISDKFGFCVRYFRLNADDRSRDVILKEYSQYKGKEVKDLKILIPDNNLPKKEIQYTSMGMENSDLFEIHIVKSEFEQVFGEGNKPQMRDYIWWPKIDKIYEINAVAPGEEEFMYESSFYRANLVIWSDRSDINYDDTPEMIEEIQSIATSQEELYGEEIKDEFKKVTKPLQYGTLQTGEKDFIRKEISRNLIIKEEKIKNNFTIISKNYYQLSTIPNIVGTVYRHQNGIATNENKSFTFWLRPQIKKTYQQFVVTSIVNVSNKPEFTTTSNHGYQVGDVVKISGTNSYNGYQRILSVTDTTFILNTTYVDFAITQPKSRKIEINKFLVYGTSSDDFSLQISNDLFIINILGKDYFYIFSTPLVNGNWFSFVVNLSNEYKQLSLFVWQTENQTNLSSTSSAKLDNIFTETKTITSTVLENGKDWKLIGCNVDLTNLRLFKDTIEVEEQSQVLNQYIVADSHLAEIIDNASPEIRLASFYNSK